MKRTFRTLDETRVLLAVARGEAPPDLLVTGGEILNVYSGEVLRGSVAVAAGRIAYAGPRAVQPGPGTTLVDARGRVVAPGYVDPHAHPHALFTPTAFARAVLPLGTTTVVSDSLPLLYLTPPERTADLMAALSALPVRFFWFLRLHGQSHSPLDDRLITDDRLAGLRAVDQVRTVGEVTRWPLVHAGDETLLRRIAASLTDGRRVEGHAPGVSADRLQVLAAAGISSDHEAITAEQALDRLRAGLYVMLRHGSLRPDLPALAAVAQAGRAFSGRLMVTPDGPSADFIASKGYLDHVIQVALQLGLDPFAVYQMATLNPATYYSLDEELGGIAPGRRADLLLLDGLDRPRPHLVIAGGRVVARDGRLEAPIPDPPWDAWLRPYTSGSWRPSASLFTLDGLPDPAPAMHLENSVIASRRDVGIRGGLPPGVQLLTLVDPAGHWRCRGLLSGFADEVGGLASTYATAAGVYALGRHAADMAAAASRALDLGGGIVWVQNGEAIFELPLPLGGMMSPRSVAEVGAAVQRLTDLLRARGYVHDDISYTLLFLGFDSLPYVRMTYQGLWDVMVGRAILPREELSGECPARPDETRG
ncbi:MAG: adenine deaminase C-terminal domain-containing protein [Armatimonadota bacterium]|nr:adenine deaminase C-terminal domain-containing protein [Armatimonadota bacterium]